MACGERVNCWARIRSTNKFATDVYQIQPDCKTINILSMGAHLKIPCNPIGVTWSFPLNGVFHNTTQKCVYETLIKDTACHVFDGYNGCVICYGQTGSGKTYTMTGLKENFENRGITPRAIEHAFRHAACDKNRSYKFMVSYVQVYNEVIYDLLSSCHQEGNNTTNNNTPNNNIPNNPTNNNTENPTNNTTNNADNCFNHNNKNNNCCYQFNDRSLTRHLNAVKIKEVCGCVMVPGLKVMCVSSEDEALNLLFEGEVNRAIASHKLNNKSSRSHCIFTIYVQSSSLVDSDSSYKISRLHLVDLAGSERIKRTMSEGRTRHEAAYINKSLVFLEQVVLASTRKKGGHIPYRRSKLTHFLKDSIGGASRTVFIANIYADTKHIDESVSTLRFAMTMKRVPVCPVLQANINPSGWVNELCKKVCSLKEQLSVQNALVGKTAMTYEEPSEEEKEAIRKKVLLYLNGQLKDLEVTGLMQVREIFNFFKQHQEASKEHIDEEYRQKYVMLDCSDPEVLKKAVEAGLMQTPPNYVTPSLQSHSKAADLATSDKKKADEKTPAEGKSGDQAVKDANGGEQENEEEEDEEETDEEGEEKKEKSGGDNKEKVELVGFKKVQIPPSRNHEFEVFKMSDGGQLTETLFKNKAWLKASKHEYTLVAQEVNKMKGLLEECASNIKAMQAADCCEGIHHDPVTGQRVVTEAEYEELKRLSTLKKHYKEQHAELMSLQTKVSQGEVCLHQSRCKLLHAFDFWFLKKYPRSEC